MQLVDESVSMLEEDLLSVNTAAHATMTVPPMRTTDRNFGLLTTTAAGGGGGRGDYRSASSSSSSSSSGSFSSIGSRLHDVSVDLHARVPSLFGDLQDASTINYESRYVYPSTPHSGLALPAAVPLTASIQRRLSVIDSSRRDRANRGMQQDHNYENVPPSDLPQHYESFTETNLRGVSTTQDGKISALPFQRGVWESRYAP